MKDDEKIRYIYSHVQDLKEDMENLKKYLKYVSDDIKIVEKLSKPEIKIK